MLLIYLALRLSIWQEISYREIIENSDAIKYTSTNIIIDRDYSTHSKEVRVITEFTSCANCLTEINEIINLSYQKFGMEDFIVTVYLLYSDSLDAKEFLDIADLSNVDIKAINNPKEIEAILSQNTTDYEAQVQFIDKNIIKYIAKLEESIVTDRKSKIELLNKIN